MTDDGGVICRLLPRVQPYAWGSLTAMTELLGIPSTGGTMAELWLGDQHYLTRFQNFLSHYPEISKSSGETAVFDLRIDDRILAK